MRYLLALALLLMAVPAAAPPWRLPEVVAHDNKSPAGHLGGNRLEVRLVAGRGTWYPEGRQQGNGLDIHAFGEDGGALSNPGPLLRVPAGTEILALIRNDLGVAITIHGLHDRPGAPVARTIAPGATDTARFRVSAPGTYHYWGSTREARDVRQRWGDDSQLAGALIVDPPGVSASDHVFMLGIADSAGPIPGARRLWAAAINGRAWPHSQTTTVRVGDTVRMRWINTTDRLHPMHLHGFYFDVDSHGDGAADTSYTAAQRRAAITELMLPGQTFTLTWVPDQPGNWLMHCHMSEHLSRPQLPGMADHHAARQGGNHTMDAMGGLVVGWRVLPAPGRATRDDGTSDVARRRLRMMLGPLPPPAAADGKSIGFAIRPADSIASSEVLRSPGPPLILTRGEPVEIRVVNYLTEPTSIHWHGMELDSYFDGVSGWSGAGERLAPQVEPRDSFAVRFTPPRAGTFIYHSHFDEDRQLRLGLYGPLIVLEPGASWDRTTDRAWVLSQAGLEQGVRIMMNGSLAPREDLAPGTRYRIRLININPNIPLLFSLMADSVPMRWRAIAKDGADLPPGQAREGPARVRIGVGETYDFELVTPAQPVQWSIQGLDPAGSRRLSGVVRVR